MVDTYSTTVSGAYQYSPEKPLEILQSMVLFEDRFQTYPLAIALISGSEVKGEEKLDGVAVMIWFLGFNFLGSKTDLWIWLKKFSTFWAFTLGFHALSKTVMIITGT